MKPVVLVCDDETVARRGVIRALGPAYEYVECADGAECLQILPRRPVDLVLLDLHMPGMDGQTTLGEIVKRAVRPPVVVLTADASLRSAIDAVKTGATDFVAKPYEIDELRWAVAKAIETSRLERENRRLSEEVRRLGGSSSLMGSSAVMRRVFETIDKVAPTSASVLITGESGTGKELAARRLHRLSAVANGPFVPVNCSAIPDTLVESELFGHRRGAFTGADRDRAGKFQEADGGTLFLDEIGDMALDAQAKLLRALEQGEVEPLGGGPKARVRVRVLAASHRDLKRRVEEGAFREDLLFRLRVVELRLPALREREEDVLLLARHFLEALGGSRYRLDPRSERLLLRYRWPGNVRELRNVVERALIFSRDGLVRPEDLPAELHQDEPSPAATENIWRPGEAFQSAKEKVIARFEKEILSDALAAHRGNISQAARALGLHRQNLQQKLRRLGIAAETFKKD